MRFAGVPCAAEEEGVVAGSHKRPDVVIKQSDASGPTWTDVRTNVSTSLTNCRRSASDPGYANRQGDLLKNADWSDLAESQGAGFFALSFEAHGRMGVPAGTLLSRLANTSGSTIVERSGFLRWARTLLHVTNMRGVAAVLRETTPIRPGPHLLRPVLETAAPRAGLRSISLAHDPAPVDFPRHDPAYMAPTLPLPASASTSAVATAPHALASERTGVLPRPAFAYKAPTSPLPASAPAFERRFLPLHGLRLPS
jgi:hypothetical protein